MLPDGRVKWRFGIARISSDSTMNTGQVIGTPGYMSPDRSGGRLSGRRADILAQACSCKSS